MIKRLISLLTVCALATGTACAVQAEEGTVASPLNALEENTVTIYEDDSYLGTFTFQLEEYLTGKEAEALLEETDLEFAPEGYLWHYLVFKAAQTEGEEGLIGLDLIWYSSFFGEDSTLQLSDDDSDDYWAVGNDDNPLWDVNDIQFFEGEEEEFMVAFAVPEGVEPVTLRLQTGYDEKEEEPLYTWFTLEKD